MRIEGPCYIGARAEIRHSAYLRAGSWVCEEAVVGHSSEVKNSILLPNSKAPSLQLCRGFYSRNGSEHRGRGKTL